MCWFQADPNEITSLRRSEKFSDVFHIVINSEEEDSVVSKVAGNLCTLKYYGIIVFNMNIISDIYRETNLHLIYK